MIELEAQAAGQQRDAELVEADALALGFGRELGVQPDGESQEELAGGFHGANSIAYGIDNGSITRNTTCMNTAAATQQARDVFAGQDIAGVQTVYVSTFVQVGRFTAREARDIRTWAIQAMVERIGEQATADWIAEAHA